MNRIHGPVFHCVLPSSLSTFNPKCGRRVEVKGTGIIRRRSFWGGAEIAIFPSTQVVCTYFASLVDRGRDVSSQVMATLLFAHDALVAGLIIQALSNQGGTVSSSVFLVLQSVVQVVSSIQRRIYLCDIYIKTSQSSRNMAATEQRHHMFRACNKTNM